MVIADKLQKIQSSLNNQSLCLNIHQEFNQDKHPFINQEKCQCFNQEYSQIILREKKRKKLTESKRNLTNKAHKLDLKVMNLQIKFSPLEATIQKL
jgi:hypothetical protein